MSLRVDFEEEYKRWSQRPRLPAPPCRSYQTILQHTQRLRWQKDLLVRLPIESRTGVRTVDSPTTSHNGAPLPISTALKTSARCQLGTTIFNPSTLANSHAPLYPTLKPFLFLQAPPTFVKALQGIIKERLQKPTPPPTVPEGRGPLAPLTLSEVAEQEEERRRARLELHLLASQTLPEELHRRLPRARLQSTTQLSDLRTTSP